MRCSSSTILVEMLESFFISGVTLLVRSESSSSSFTHRRRRRRIAIRTSSWSFFSLGFAQGVPVVAVAAEHLANRFQVQRNALADGALVGVVLGGGDFHRPVEGKIAVVHLLENFNGALKAVIAFEHLGAENLAGDFDLLGQGNFLLAGEQGNLAHLGQIHAHRIVDALGGSLGQFGFEIQVDLFAVLVLDDLPVRRRCGRGGGFLAAGPWRLWQIRGCRFRR